MEENNLPGLSFEKIHELHSQSFNHVIKRTNSIEHLKALAAGIKKAIQRIEFDGGTTFEANKLLEKIRARAKEVLALRPGEILQKEVYTPKFDHVREFGTNKIIKYAWQVQKEWEEAQKSNPQLAV